jgi:uncharacterized protein
MSIQEYLNAPFRAETPIKNLTIVHVAPGATIPPHHHSQGYVVVPFVEASLERLTHHKDQVVRREPLALLPFVPYFMDPTQADHPISIKNLGSGLSTFQKMVPEPPITKAQPELPTENISVLSKGTRHTFIVEIATEFMQQATGLMFRPKLASDHGMIFVWRPARKVAMYMRNVEMPLDFLFVDANYKISHIHENATVENSLAIQSMGEVVFAVEIPAGSVARLGISKGDIVEV